MRVIISRKSEGNTAVSICRVLFSNGLDADKTLCPG